MVDGYKIARPVAERLHQLFVEGQGKTVLDDGTKVVIQHAGYTALSYEVCPDIADDEEPEWLVSARDDGDINPQELPFLYVATGDQYWSVGNQTPVPEWALPILRNFVAIEEAA